MCVSMRIVQVSEKSWKRVEIVCLFVIVFTTISLFALPVIFHYVQVSFPDELYIFICTIGSTPSKPQFQPAINLGSLYNSCKRCDHFWRMCLLPTLVLVYMHCCIRVHSCIFSRKFIINLYQSTYIGLLIKLQSFMECVYCLPCYTISGDNS